MLPHFETNATAMYVPGTTYPGTNHYCFVSIYFLCLLFVILFCSFFSPRHGQADEADLLLSMVEDPGSFAVIVMKTLRGYFLLMKGREQDVLDMVALPVYKALEADHGVLHFPLCWHM